MSARSDGVSAAGRGTRRGRLRTDPSEAASLPDVKGRDDGSASRISDDELLQAAGRGNRTAFEEYYRRNAPWLLVRLRRRCGEAELAADVVQETFLAVWRAAASYSGTGQSGGWLWSIATRRLVDAYRRRAARGEAVGEPYEELVHAPSAEEEALSSSYGAGLAGALQRLSPELRAVLQATVLDGLSTREAAVLLDLPEGTIKSRARRARLQLKEALA